MLLLPLGIIVVPLDKALPDNEIESSVIRSEVEAVIFDKKYLDVFKNLQSNPDCKLKHFICMDFEEDNEEVLSLSNLIEKGKDLRDRGDKSYDEVIIEIEKRSKNPEGFEKYISTRKRKNTYYRIYVKNYTIFYIVKENSMEVRRILYSRRNFDKLV